MPPPLVRLYALASFSPHCPAFRPTIPVSYLIQELAFLDAEEFRDYLKKTETAVICYKSAPEFPVNLDTIGDLDAAIPDLVMDSKASAGAFAGKFTFSVMDGDSVGVR